MKLSFLFLQNIRCFHSFHKIDLSRKINIFVGPNNSGKSTILRAIYMVQQNMFSDRDATLDSIESIVRIGVEHDGIKVRINGQSLSVSNTPNVWIESKYFKSMEWVSSDSNSFLTGPFTHLGVFRQYPTEEPNNLVYPFFSNRKVDSYSQNISITESNKITGTNSNLYAKVDRLINPSKSTYNLFRKSCLEILGFYVSSESSIDGKYTAFTVDDNRDIPLNFMGTGVASILSLIVDICAANGKIFIIEEPENDIHPKALKGLLRLIEAKSDTNQFFISTHSNVVVRYLGADSAAKVFHVYPDDTITTDLIRIPKSYVKEVPNNTEDRLKILEDLGYEMFDYALWKGWLFLEESSAEVIIREFLIPNFTPSIRDKIRTYSSRSISHIENKFEDFNNLFVYIHLDPSYKNRAWVLIDGGDEEKMIIDKFKEDYTKNGWKEDQFKQFSRHNFEDYYPSFFANDVAELYTIDEGAGNRKEKKRRKMNAKKVLLDKVKEWYNANPDEAKKAFKESAGEVIGILKEIEVALT